MARKQPKDPNEPTKAQAKLLHMLRVRDWGVYISHEDGERFYRAHPSGQKLFGPTIKKCISKGLLSVVSLDLQGEPQQWGVK